MNESVFARRKAERKAVGAVEPAATAAAASTEAQAEPSIPEQAPVSIEETVPAPEATASADAAGAAESESAGSAWKGDPMSPSGSVFKLSPSIWDAPARVEAAEEPAAMASYAPPILAAVPAEEAAADPEPACQPATSLPAPEWAPASLGISSAAKAADTGPAFGGASGIGPAPFTGEGAGGNQGSGGSGGGWGGGGTGGGQSGGGPGKRRLPIILGVAAALIVLIGGGGFFVLHNSGKPSTSAAGGAGKSKTKVVVAVAKGPEHVSSISPTDGATDVNGGAPVVVTFSEPLSPTSPMPTLKPDIKGNWQVSGDKATFIPAKGFWQRTKVKVTVPAGATGVESNGGGKLATPVTASFKTGKFSLVRLEQLLGQLGYLPLTWAPSSGTPAPMSNLNAQYSAAYAPPQGTYSWDSGYPARLTSLWKPDAPSEILRGAVAAFLADHDFITDMIAENQEGLVVSGSIGQELWKAMFKAVARDQKNKNGYTYAVASQHQPETLTVWHDGKIIFHHLANTGVPAAPTAARTDPVYIRYQSQIMRGANPDGSKYADQVYWVAYFHAGEAVHYFNRSAYGYQQSLGCVELPYSEAKQIWPYLTYGTLVTVTKV